MNKLKSFILRFPLIILTALFLSVAAPINYFFLGDKPNNPLEKAEELAIQVLLGIDVDIHPED